MFCVFKQVCIEVPALFPCPLSPAGAVHCLCRCPGMKVVREADDEDFSDSDDDQARPAAKVDDDYLLRKVRPLSAKVVHSACSSTARNCLCLQHSCHSCMKTTPCPARTGARSVGQTRSRWRRRWLQRRSRRRPPRPRRPSRPHRQSMRRIHLRSAARMRTPQFQCLSLASGAFHCHSPPFTAFRCGSTACQVRLGVRDRLRGGGRGGQQQRQWRGAEFGETASWTISCRTSNL